MKTAPHVVLLFLAALAPSCTSGEGALDTSRVEANSSDEEFERNRIISAVDLAITSKDLAGLSEMADKYRQSRARTPSGSWQSEIFHIAIQFQTRKNLQRSTGCQSPLAPLVRDWLESDPDQPAAIITMADLELAEGWCFRGTGYSDEVSEQGWKEFRKHSRAAYDMLETKRDQASSDPEFYAVMAAVYRALNKTPRDLRLLLDEATSREPYYLRTYFSASHSFLPQWGGSAERLDDFARYAAERTAASDKTGFYYRVYWYLEDCACASPWTVGDWEEMKQAMRDVYERYPVDFNARHMLDVSCKAGDTDEALRYLRLLYPDATGDADFAAQIAACKWQAARAG